jgi:hypothetical protein
MEEWTSEDLSPEESELLIDFIEWLGNFDRQVLEKQTIEGDNNEVGLEDAIEYLAPYVSQDASEFDSQLFRLFRLKNEISEGPIFEYEYEDDLPPDAVVTPGELNRFLIKDELEEFFTLAGQMAEMLTVRLLISEVVDDSRESESVRRRVENKSQREREWLLYVTGTISNGQKSEVRRLYKLRSSIVHNSDSSEDFLEIVNVPSDIDRTINAINELHEELHGIELKHRFGDLIA